jgi:hypothetical protein
VVDIPTIKSITPAVGFEQLTNERPIMVPVGTKKPNAENIRRVFVLDIFPL